MVESLQHLALCKSCGYPLRELVRTRCPECGRDFDPGDPKNMAVRGWVRGIDRFLIAPPGWGQHLFGVALLVVSIFTHGCASIFWLPFIAFWLMRIISWAALCDYYGREYGLRRPAWHWVIEPALLVLTVFALVFMH